MNGIIFENIDTKETVLISIENEGKYYKSKLAAIMNSSNISPNADRGQDYGWRLQPEQQAILEMWESDPDMIDKVSAWAKVPTDGMAHDDFLAYLLHQQELGKSPEKVQAAQRRDNQLSYEKRVEELREQDRPDPVPAFGSRYGLNRNDATLDDFLNGRLDDTDPAVIDEPQDEEPSDVPLDLPEIEAPEVLEAPKTDKPEPKLAPKRATKK